MAVRRLTRPFVRLHRDVLVRSDLGSTAKLVYALIVDAMRDKGVSWPGTRRIAREIGVSQGAVLRALADLKSAGLLVVESRANGRSNLYHLPHDDRYRNGIAFGGSGKTRTDTEMEAGDAETVSLPLSKRQHKKTRRKKKTKGGASRKRAASPSHLPEAPPELPDEPSSPWTRDRKPPGETTKDGKLNPSFLVHRLACAAEEVLNQPFSPTWGRDGKALKTHLCLGAEEIEKRWRTFLERSLEDGFLRKQRKISYFAANINAYIPELSEFDRELAEVTCHG